MILLIILRRNKGSFKDFSRRAQARISNGRKFITHNAILKPDFIYLFSLYFIVQFIKILTSNPTITQRPQHEHNTNLKNLRPQPQLHDR